MSEVAPFFSHLCLSAKFQQPAAMMSSEQMSAGRRSEVSAVSGDLDRTDTDESQAATGLSLFLWGQAGEEKAPLILKPKLCVVCRSVWVIASSLLVGGFQEPKQM